MLKSKPQLLLKEHARTEEWTESHHQYYVGQLKAPPRPNGECRAHIKTIKAKDQAPALTNLETERRAMG